MTNDTGPGGSARADAERPNAETAQIRRISAKQLFDGATEVLIDHDAAQYRLRITSNGKLILTK